eukprot:855022-Amphidinium_carterae.1
MHAHAHTRTRTHSRTVTRARARARTPAHALTQAGARTDRHRHKHFGDLVGLCHPGAWGGGRGSSGSPPSVIDLEQASKAARNAQWQMAA